MSLLEVKADITRIDERGPNHKATLIDRVCHPGAPE
jgi:hypothetical protein